MIYIHIDNILLSVLILSCVLKGAAGELLFCITLSILLFRNRRLIRENEYRKILIFIIFLYILLMTIQIKHLYPDVSWRIVGLTKCLCGIPLCILFTSSSYKKGLINLLVIYSVFFNVMACCIRSGLITDQFWGHSFIEFPGINSCGCLSLMLAPHILRLKEKKWMIYKILYFASLIFIFLTYNATTFRVSLLICAIFYIFSKLKLNGFSQIYGMIRRNKKITAVIVIAVILAAVRNDQIRNRYMVLLSRLDYSRFRILEQAFDKWIQATGFERLFGFGDNMYGLKYGILSEAHNFIMEVLMIYGTFGIIVLIIETYVFIELIFSLKRESRCFPAIMVTLIIAYLYFMLHPYYSSSFIIKLYMVEICISVSTYGTRSDKLQNGLNIYDRNIKNMEKQFS